MSRLLLGGEEDGGGAIEFVAISYTDTLGTVVMFVTGAPVLPSITETLGTVSMTVVSAAPGRPQAWIAQG